MFPVFYVAGLVALVSTVMVVTRRNPIHALLYFILSLVAVAVIFLDAGAPFVAALEVIIYAGAIMVLFIFVVMLLNPGVALVIRAREWIGPAILSLLLTLGIVYSVVGSTIKTMGISATTPKDIAMALFGPYLLGVELASLLLLAGLVAAYHLGRRIEREAPARGASLQPGAPVGSGAPSSRKEGA